MKYSPLLIALLLCHFTYSETIAEKMNQALARSTEERVNIDAALKEVNETIVALRHKLDGCYAKARQLHKENAQDAAFQQVLDEINAIRADMRNVHGHGIAQS
jgi:hypothetical protein